MNFKPNHGCLNSLWVFIYLLIIDINGPENIDMRYIGVVIHLLRIIDGTPQFLFLCRSSGKFKKHWWPIAGKIKKDENPSTAAFREIKEETGIVLKQLYDTGMTVPHIGTNARPDEKICIYIGFVSPDAKVSLNCEHIDFRWLSFDEATNIVNPKAQVITRFVLNSIKKNFIDNDPPESLRIVPFI